MRNVDARREEISLPPGERRILCPCCAQADSRFELHCSSDVIHIRTCSDSCAALMNLIQYVASYGDLHAPHQAETKPGAPQRKPPVGSAAPPICTSPCPRPPAPQSGCMRATSTSARSPDSREAEEKLKYPLSVPHLRTDGAWEGDSTGLFGKPFCCLPFFVSEHYSAQPASYFSLDLSYFHLSRGKKHLSCNSLLYANHV